MCQYTSATLGGKDADSEITQFAQSLCDVPFDSSDIIRSEDGLPPIKVQKSLPFELFSDLAKQEKNVNEVLSSYHVDDISQGTDDSARIYELLLHSDAFAQLIANTRKPITLMELTQLIPGFSKTQLQDLITVCSMAERDNTSLIRVRYHFFVRATEGAYITLNNPRQLFLQRKEHIELPDGTPQKVFEIAVCQDCGRISLVGKIDVDGYLRQISRKSGRDPKACDYFLLVDDSFTEMENDEESEHETESNDFVVCACCGLMGSKADLQFGAICDCQKPVYRYLKQVNRTSSGIAKCPGCGFGSLRAFYLGNDAATSVLGTELFEQLPDHIVKMPTVQKTVEPPRTGAFSLFSAKRDVKPVVEKNMRQFLCFSDSRSEAAFFANYMEKSYQEFLRRRAILQVADQMKKQGQTECTVPGLVERLTRFFVEHKTFQIWDPDSEKKSIDKDKLKILSEGNAWIAVLNEMFNAKRGTSLMSLGRLAFSYQPNEAFISAVAEEYHLKMEESQALLDQLAMDAVYMGAINAESAWTLNDAEREYIFFTPYEKHLVLQKNSSMSNGIQGWAGRKRESGTYYTNTRMQRLQQLIGMTPEQADEFLEAYWTGVFQPEGEQFILSAEDFSVRFLGDEHLHFYKCIKCGMLTPYNIKNKCSDVRCSGSLKQIDPIELFHSNHYLKLYQSQQMESLQIKEHTAQLSKNHQTRYQQAFVNKDIHALSCSTTFEMGVDVGSLETVYMRNIPPSPANYVQRAGRAGRSKQSAAYVLTYAKLSSHDMTFYQSPETIISGSIKVPVFSLQNEKVINRHIYAVALSKFLALHEEIYANDNQSVLLNENGYEVFKDYLASKPEDLRQLLMRSVPENMHNALGILDYSWTEKLVGDDGILEISVNEFRSEVEALKAELKRCDRNKDREGAARAERDLQSYRCAEEDKKPKKRLIDFLVRSNVLPKYGFPVDTVELQPANAFMLNGRDTLQLSRDLSLAIAEYAPGAEVIADGKMYTSRYIRKLPGKENSSAWEIGYYCKCPNCQEPNFSKKSETRMHGGNCISCKEKIPRKEWKMTLEPRRGFWTEDKPKDVPLRKPERDYKTDDYYIGDLERQRLMKLKFTVNGQVIEMDSTANDSLAVVGLTDYYVCETCGYASEEMVPPSHKTPRGYPCKNKKSGYSRYRLSHTFKTFVAKLKFCTIDATNQQIMLSVLYALLEGLSRELGIERTDLKGCLHQELWSGSQRPIYSVILYDAVAGGAGHVRRLITEDAVVFQKVLSRAIQVMTQCTCDPSCYQCLRNYYNSQIHDLLDRNQAAGFLKQWVGEYVLENDEPLSNPEIETASTELKENKGSLCKIDLKNRGRSFKNMSGEAIWEQVINDLEDSTPDERAIIENLMRIHLGTGGNPVYQEYFFDS